MEEFRGRFSRHLVPVILLYPVASAHRTSSSCVTAPPYSKWYQLEDSDAEYRRGPSGPDEGDVSSSKCCLSVGLGETQRDLRSCVQ
ncbi:hypothetical protein EDD85DRAFT_133317 [Armillaria nabsnona]|nr:hypothetical protein EDD85DRAFT_133317 [Armillaria nabsnona]